MRFIFRKGEHGIDPVFFFTLFVCVVKWRGMGTHRKTFLLFVLCSVFSVICIQYQGNIVVDIVGNIIGILVMFYLGMFTPKSLEQ